MRYSYIILGPISELRTHKQESKQANSLCLVDSSLRKRELYDCDDILSLYRKIREKTY
jgi:hypothetical protein